MIYTPVTPSYPDHTATLQICNAKTGKDRPKTDERRCRTERAIGNLLPEGGTLLQRSGSQNGPYLVLSMKHEVRLRRIKIEGVNRHRLLPQ